MKKFIVSLIMFSLLVTLVLAAPISKTIRAIFNTAQFKLGSKTANIETVTYNNKVYVPLSDIAKLNDLKVVYDSKANIYYLPSAYSQFNSQVGYSRQNPAPIGTTLVTIIDNYSTKYTFKVTLLDVKRGEEAWELIQNDETAKDFSNPPKEGKEYILAKFRFELIKLEGEDSAFMLNKGLFTIYSSNNKAYELSLTAYEPNPKLSNDSMFEGSSCEGWTLYEVDANDKAPIWSFNSQGYGNKGIWFKLYK